MGLSIACQCSSRVLQPQATLHCMLEAEVHHVCISAFPCHCCPMQLVPDWPDLFWISTKHNPHWCELPCCILETGLCDPKNVPKLGHELEELATPEKAASLSKFTQRSLL